MPSVRCQSQGVRELEAAGETCFVTRAVPVRKPLLDHLQQGPRVAPRQPAAASGASMGKGGAKRMKAGGYDSSYTLSSPCPTRSGPLGPSCRSCNRHHVLPGRKGAARLPRAHCRSGRRCGRGQYSSDGAMRDSNSQFSVKFYAKFFSCVICSLFIVGMAFYVMNSWLGVSPASRSVCCCTAPLGCSYSC